MGLRASPLLFLGSNVPILDEVQSDFPLGPGYLIRLVLVSPETDYATSSAWAPSLRWGQSRKGPAENSGAYR